MKRSWLFCTLLACLAFVAIPALTVPAAAGVPADFVAIETERISAPVAVVYSADLKSDRIAPRNLVYSSFTLTTAARPGASAGYRRHCPGFLIGTDPDKRPNSRALAVPWCRRAN